MEQNHILLNYKLPSISAVRLIPVLKCMDSNAAEGTTYAYPFLQEPCVLQWRLRGYIVHFNESEKRGDGYLVRSLISPKLSGELSSCAFIAVFKVGRLVHPQRADNNGIGDERNVYGAIVVADTVITIVSSTDCSLCWAATAPAASNDWLLRPWLPAASINATLANFAALTGCGASDSAAVPTAVAGGNDGHSVVHLVQELLWKAHSPGISNAIKGWISTASHTAPHSPPASLLVCGRNATTGSEILIWEALRRCQGIDAVMHIPADALHSSHVGGYEQGPLDTLAALVSSAASSPLGQRTPSAREQLQKLLLYAVAHGFTCKQLHSTICDGICSSSGINSSRGRGCGQGEVTVVVVLQHIDVMAPCQNKSSQSLNAGLDITQVQHNQSSMSPS